MFISNYAYMQLQQQIARTPGVGNTQIFGQRQYAMRIWLDPVRMTALGITAADVIAAIQAQNIQVAAGQIGQPPVAGNQQQQLTVLAPGALSTVPAIRRTSSSAPTRTAASCASATSAASNWLRSNTRSSSALDGTAVGHPRDLPDAQRQRAGAGDTRSSSRCRSSPKQFPPGLKYAIVYNATNFVRANIDEIVQTLAITLVLVVAVVFVFLQDWRATLIPTIAIPVSLIGVFAVLYVLGYSANTVNLFAIVLAITLVVDDAIVVVENVSRARWRKIRTCRSAEATEQAMREIAGPVIATTLVLVAVFVPVGFVSGITGALYRQFAVTISVSVVISAVNALTLSPALCALMLRPPKKARFFGFRWFNRGFDFARDRLRRRGGLPVALAAAEPRSGSSACFGAGVSRVAAHADRPSCRTRTRATSSSTCRCRTAPRSAARRRWSTRSASIAAQDAGRGARHRAGGLQPRVRRAAAERRHRVIAIMQPWDQRGASQAIPAVIAKLQPHASTPSPAAQIVSFNPPVDPRHQHHRRHQLRAGGARRAVATRNSPPPPAR